MNGDISWMHYTEINFLTRKSVRKLWKVQIFLVIMAVKFSFVFSKLKILL